MRDLRELGRCAYIAGRTFLLGSNAASLRLWKRPVSAYRYCNTALFTRDALNGRGLPEVRIEEVFPNVTDARLEFPALQHAWRWQDPSYLADLVHLAQLCQATKPRRIFEIGTSTGYTSLLMAANADETTEIWTLDLPSAHSDTATPLTTHDRSIVRDCHQQQPCFVGHPLGTKIHRLFGDSAEFNFSQYRGIDLFFIDGAHTYEYVRRDTERALTCCSDSGMVVWHDYGRPGLSRGVTTYLNDLSSRMAVYCTPGSSIAFAPPAESMMPEAEVVSHDSIAGPYVQAKR